MKKIKGFNEYFINENSQNSGIEVDQKDWKRFVDLMRDLKFEEAFNHAMTDGIFGGTFDDYLESRDEGGPQYSHIIKAYEEYTRAAENLSSLILQDIENSTENFEEE